MQFLLDEEYITLQQLLKICGIADTGGIAKILITEGNVAVNGKTETRRGRKLRSGDTVTVGTQTISVQ